jgi:hypothetical protein
MREVHELQRQTDLPVNSVDILVFPLQILEELFPALAGERLTKRSLINGIASHRSSDKTHDNFSISLS